MQTINLHANYSRCIPAVGDGNKRRKFLLVRTLARVFDFPPPKEIFAVKANHHRLYDYLLTEIFLLKLSKGHLAEVAFHRRQKLSCRRIPGPESKSLVIVLLK